MPLFIQANNRGLGCESSATYTKEEDTMTQTETIQGRPSSELPAVAHRLTS